MKKSIAALALTAAAVTSNAASAMPSFEPQEQRTYCLSFWTAEDGGIQLGTCDQSRNNKQDGKELLENGCAKGQAALVTAKDIKIGNCIPSGARQL